MTCGPRDWCRRPRRRRTRRYSPVEYRSSPGGIALRVLTGSLMQASNTFAPVAGDLSLFRGGCLLFEDESLARHAAMRTELGGFIASARQAEIELVPTIAAWAPSGGPL